MDTLENGVNDFAPQQQIIAQIKNLDIPFLESSLFRPERAEQIRQLLSSVVNVELVPYSKTHSQSDTHLRWIFQNEQGQNVASAIYLIIAQDQVEFIQNKYNSGTIKLGVYGSAVKGRSTFPISQELPEVEGQTLISSSDIDLFIMGRSSSDHRLALKIKSEVAMRLEKIAENLPPEIRFNRNAPNFVSKWELENHYLRYTEF